MAFQPYSSGKITKSPSTGVFDRYLDVYGLRLFALSNFGGVPAPEDEFIEKTAQTVKLMLDPDGAGINKKKQRKAIKFMSKQSTMQRIGVDSYDRIKTQALMTVLAAGIKSMITTQQLTLRISCATR